MADYHGRDCYFLRPTAAIMVMLVLVVARKQFKFYPENNPENSYVSKSSCKRVVFGCVSVCCITNCLSSTDRCPYILFMLLILASLRHVHPIKSIKITWLSLACASLLLID